MRTVSTLSLGAFAADAAGGCVAAADGLLTVPLISTLCPTCGESFASSASRRYSLATDVLDGVPAAPLVPAVPALASGLSAAFVSRNFGSLAPRAAGAPAIPLVPVGACSSARWTQPVTVMLLADALFEGPCVCGSSCASSPAVSPKAIAAHVAVQILVLIRAPFCSEQATTGCNCGATAPDPDEPLEPSNDWSSRRLELVRRDDPLRPV